MEPRWWREVCTVLGAFGRLDLVEILGEQFRETRTNERTRFLGWVKYLERVSEDNDHVSYLWPELRRAIESGEEPPRC